MTLLMRDNKMRAEGREQGRAEGRMQGRVEGELEKGIRVYQNLRKRGFSKEEALSLADIPASAVEEAGVTVHPQA